MAEAKLEALESLRQQIPETAKDLKINLSNVLRSEHLTEAQLWAIAIASAAYLRDSRLLDAIVADARAEPIDETVERDARAAAALMAMNTVYYRFRHLVGKEEYGQLPARLRMQWMLRPQSDKVTFELCSLAVAALAGCEACIQAHEKSLLEQGLTPAHIHDAVRLAAVLNGVSVALGT